MLTARLKLETTGGATSHSHLYGLNLGGFNAATLLAEQSNAGLIHYNSSNQTSVKTISTAIGNRTYSINKAAINYSSYTSETAAGKSGTANTSYVSTLPPYLAVYMWKRTA